MTAELPTGRVSYAERKVAFYEGEAESWLKHYREEQACLDHEALLRDVNLLAKDVMSLDFEIHALYSDGVPFDEELDGRLVNLFERWHKLAVNFEVVSKGFETTHYAVDGIKELRHHISEFQAILNPGDELGSFADFAQLAIREDAEGKTVNGLMD